MEIGQTVYIKQCKGLGSPYTVAKVMSVGRKYFSITGTHPSVRFLKETLKQDGNTEDRTLFLSWYDLYYHLLRQRLSYLLDTHYASKYGVKPRELDTLAVERVFNALGIQDVMHKEVNDLIGHLRPKVELNSADETHT